MRDLSSAMAGLGAGAALNRLVNEMKQAVEAAIKLHSAFAGLNAVAKGFGVQTKDAQQAVQDLASRGFLSLTEAAQAYKTALSTGLSLDESTKLITSLADSAAYGRQSFYTMGGAIQASLDGIKNGNSVLADAVGVTKNLSVMQKEYAASIGTTAGRLTDAQKIQAAYNGFIREGIYYVGNADEAMQGIVGSQARFTQATNEASVAFGEAFTPLFQTLLETVTPAIIALADFTSENKALVSAAAASSVGMLALVAILATVPPALNLIKAGFIALEAAAGPIGWIVLAVGALAGGIAYLTTTHSEAAKATAELAKKQTELNALLGKAPIDRTAADIETLKSKTEELNPVLEERARLQKRLNELRAAQENDTWMPEMLGQTMDVNEAIGELDVKLEELGYASVEEATAKLAEMNAVVKRGTIAITDQDKAEAAALATKKQTLVQMSALANEFKTLNSAQTLDASQKNRLVDVTEQLIAQYPELNARQGEDGRIRADNIDKIISQINTDKRFTDMAAANVSTRIRNFGKESEAQAKSVQAQITNLTKLSNALAIVSGAKATSFADDVAAREADNLRKTSGLVGDIVTNGILAQAATAGAKAEVDAKVDEALKQQQKYANAAREMEQLANEVETGSQDFTKDIIAPDPKKGPKPAKPPKTKSAAELAAEARKKAYEEDLKTIQFQADFYDLTADVQIKKYEELRKKHTVFMKESVDDARTLALQIKQLSEDSVQSRYDFSATWIDAEEKRMEDSGKTELAIAETKLASWTRLRNRYAKDSEQYKAADDKVRQSRKDVATETERATRDQYDASVKWIDAESKRMERSGKSEEEIAQMKIAAWTHVRDRYTKDSEYYAKAEDALYAARKDITTKTAKLADDLVKTQQDAIKDAKTAELNAIKDAKDADLAAIKARKEEYVSAQDAKIASVEALIAAEAEYNSDADFATQLAQKNARLAELQSAVGQPGIDEREALVKEIARMELEHGRDLRKRELEAQKDALTKEKEAQNSAYDSEVTAREAAFEKAKKDTEAQYDALAGAFEAYSGDIKTIESGIAAFRVSESATANSAILTQLDTFVAQYNAKMAEVAKVNAVAQKDADLAEYNANKAAWTRAKAAGDIAKMQALSARNDELRKLYGIDKDTGELQQFRNGGIVRGAAGSAVPIVAHAGEIVLNPQQQAALFDMVANPRVVAQAPAAPTYITNHIDMGAEEVVLTDRADVAMYYDEKARAAQRLAAMGVKTL
ncbi:hypothetical protein [Paenibacillus sp. FSL R7-0128]|uniref:hypothetical protein n=1 Tax=Paenibacillus sp. FSL R7-0128 TaxID=2954529 RepID=UPI0030F9E8F7